MRGSGIPIDVQMPSEAIKEINYIMNTARKIFASALIFAMAMGFFAATPSVKAASAGQLIKMNGLSTVYYLGSDMKRYVFPNSTTYFAWYGDFNTVQTVSQSELEGYSLGANVTMRPGTWLVKITTNPTVYAVEPGGKLRSIVSEANAASLWGANWAKMVRDVPDAFFTNYTIQTPLTAGVYPAGSLVKSASSPNVYYFDGTNYRPFANEAAFTANRFRFEFVATAPSSMTLTPVGSTITAAEGSLIDTSSGAGGTPNVGTGMTAALSSDTPASATIPSNATSVPVMKFNVTAANDGDVTIDSITAKRVGVGDYNKMSSLFLYDGDTRLTNARSITSDNTIDFSGLNYTVSKGMTKTLTVKANIASGASGEHAIQIPTASSIVLVGGGTVSGSFPITGNTMTLSSVDAGTITIVKNGTLADVTIGDMGATVAQFKLTAGTEDIWFKSITLKNDGDLTTSLMSNFKLSNGTTDIPVSSVVNGRRVSLTLASPVKILNGSNKIFTLKADISASSEKGKSIKFYVENKADILATSDKYGFGVNPDISALDAGSEAEEVDTLGGGITISNLSAAAKDVKVDSTEVELMKVGLKAVSDNIEIQKMTMTLNTTQATSGGDDFGTYRDVDQDDTMDTGDTILIRNIKLKDADTGQTLGSAKAITDSEGWVAATAPDATLTFVWTDYFRVNKGATRNIKVVADINSAQVAGVVYKANLDFSGSSTNFIAKDSQDKDVTDIVPKAVISGNNVTTRTSSLTISRATTPETRTVVKGSTVDSLGMIFAAGTGEGNDIKLSGLTLNTYVDADVDGTFVANHETETIDTYANTLVESVSLYDGTNLVAGPVSVDTNGKAIFTSGKFVNGYYTINAGTNKTLIARAKLLSTAPYGATDDAYSFTFAAADVTAEDVNGGVTPTVTGTNINGTTGPSVSIRITGNGTITTSAASDKADAQIVVAGSSSEMNVHKIKFYATKEAFTVDKLTIQIGTGAGSYDDVEYVKLYDAAGTTPISGATSLDSNGKATFTNLTINVPALTETFITVFVKTTAMGERTTATDGTAGTGADTGDPLNASLSTTADDFHAVGVSSNVVDNAANAAVSNTHVVRKANLTVTTEALPTTILGNGEKTLAKFKVTAVGGPVSFKGLLPDMTLSGVTITAASVYLYDVTNGVNTQLNTTGVNEDAFIEIDDAKVPTIAAGSSKIYEIRGTVGGYVVNTGDALSTKLVKDSSALSGTTEASDDAVADANNDFIWSDNSADTHTLGTSVEWTNSILLNPFSTTEQILQ